MSNKIDRRVKYKIVLDVETANSLDDPLVYDLGWVLTDRKGRIYERRSYLIKEVFWDERETLMRTAYYSKKVPMYWGQLWEGKHKIVQFDYARRELWRMAAQYGVTEFYAYNASFDLRALNTTQRWLSSSRYRWFFPYGSKIYCIWNIAAQTILSQKTFVRQALTEGWYSEKGNLLTNAEVSFRYLTGMKEFEEAHTGLDDAVIEAYILSRCFAQHRSLDRSIKRNCWKLPQVVLEEMRRRGQTPPCEPEQLTIWPLLEKKKRGRK